MNENFGRENQLPQQIFPLSPLSMLLCHQKPPDESSVLPKNIDGGEGEEKHLCDLVGVSIQRNGEIRSLIPFVSTSFARDCSARKAFVTFFLMFLTAHPVSCNICAIPPYFSFCGCLQRMVPATLGPRCAFVESYENLSVPTSRFSRHKRHFAMPLFLHVFKIRNFNSANFHA